MMFNCLKIHVTASSAKRFSGVLKKNLSTENLWDQVNNQIRAKVGSGQKIQLLNPTIGWNFQSSGPGLIDGQAHSLVDAIPSYSEVGKYDSTSKSLHANYLAVLKNCPKIVPTSEEQQQLREIENQINKAQTAIQKLEAQKAMAWANHAKFAQDKSDDARAEWEKKNRWNERMEGDTQILEKLEATKLSIQKQQLEWQNKEKIAAAELPGDGELTKPGFALCDVNGTQHWRANYIIKDGSDWVNEMTDGGGQSLTISIDTASASASKTDSWAGASGYRGLPFFCLVGAEGKATDTQFSTKSDKLKIDITINAFTRAPIRPDVWYDSGHLENLKLRNKWNSSYSLDKVFGKDGMLPLMITGLIAGYQPSFRITNESSSMKIRESHFDGSAGLQLGPFRFGGGGGLDNTSINVSSDGKTIEGKSEATYPFIMGFTVASPALD